MSDNSFNTTYGPSSPGAVNLVSGHTHGIAASLGDISGDVVDGTLIGDADPLYDDCGSPDQVGLSGKNIGDLLNAKNITWGWFEGGFSDCKATHTTLNGGVRKGLHPASPAFHVLRLDLESTSPSAYVRVPDRAQRRPGESSI